MPNPLLIVVLGAAMQMQSGAPASSAPPPASENVEALLQRGLELRVHGQHADAVALFARAYAIRPDPLAAGQLGLAEQAAGQWVDAERHVSEALAAANDPWVVRHRAALESAYQVIRQHVGTLQIVGGVDGATLSLDGVRVASLPLAAPLHVRAGTYTLEIEAEGYYRVSRQVVISAGQITSEPIDLRRVAAREVIASPAPSASPPPIANEISASPPPAQLVVRRERPSIVPAVAFGAGAVAFGAAALGVLIHRELGAVRYADTGRPDRCEHLPPETGDPPECFDIFHRDPIEMGIGIAAVVIAVGLAVPSVYFSVRAASRPRLACGSGPGLIGGSCSLHF